MLDMVKRHLAADFDIAQERTPFQPAKNVNLVCDRAVVDKEIVAEEKKLCVVLRRDFRNWISFLCGATVPTFPGPFKSLAAYRAASDDELERNHDYVQLVFPRQNKSDYANFDYYLDNRDMMVSGKVGTPIEVLHEILNNDNSDIAAYIRGNVLENARRMLHFWGFEVVIKEDGPRRWFEFHQIHMDVVKSKLTGGNHNELRVSRLLEHLKAMGLEGCKESIKPELKKINPETYRKYWGKI
ncbi:hypothetical protein FACS189472_09090 [Alphaproteobacteria bacterium]|nr:hypothetical protein FACS189472_09090 [Alphaproteobacteria bacterium]